jgi:superoxide dismutase, Cu-Zn family
MRLPRSLRTTAVLVVLAAGVAVLPIASTAAADGSGRSARAVVRDTTGATIGTVTLTSNNGKLFVVGSLSRLTPGFHGYHIHAVGICDPRATDAAGNIVPFASAGGHLNPGGAVHGHHAGDLPLLLVASDGRATSANETDAVTLAAIFDADGAAVIIHAAPDNYANIPTRYSAAGVPGPDAATLATGDSGGRVACGVVTRDR